MHVAAASCAAVRDRRARAARHEIGEYRAALLVQHHRASRDPDHDIVAGVAVLVLAASGLAVARDQPGLVLEIQQRGHSLIDLEDNVAAPPAVSTRRPAEGPEFFAQESNSAVTAFAGAHVDPGLVDEPHRPAIIAGAAITRAVPVRAGIPQPRSPMPARCAQSGQTGEPSRRGEQMG